MLPANDMCHKLEWYIHLVMLHASSIADHGLCLRSVTCGQGLALHCHRAAAGCASPVNVRLVTGQPPPVKMAWPTIIGGGVRRGT